MQRQGIQKVVFSGLVLLWLNSCFQPQVLTLTRVEPTPAASGVTTAATPPDSMGISLCFNGLSYGYLDFTLTVRNGASDTVFIGPSDCGCIPVYGFAGASDDTLLAKALDPDHQVAWLKDLKSKEEKLSNPYNDLLFSIATGVLESILQSKEEQEKAAADRARSRDEWEIEHLRILNSLGNQIEFWRTVPMGNTIVSPGRTFSGRILFTAHPDAPWIRIRVRTGKLSCEALFRQEMTHR